MVDGLAIRKPSSHRGIRYLVIEWRSVYGFLHRILLRISFIGRKHRDAVDVVLRLAVVVSG